MRDEPAVCIDHKLPARKTGVRFKAAAHKSSGRVDSNGGVEISFQFDAARQNDKRKDLPFQILELFIIVMLAGHDDVVDAVGDAVSVFHGDLRFAVRAQTGNEPVLARGSEFCGDPMRDDDRHGQQFAGLACRIAVHDPLIACAENFRRSLIHRSGDVLALVVGQDLDFVFTDIRISHLANSFADDSRNVGKLRCGDLTCNCDLSGRRHHLAGDAGSSVRFKTGVQNLVGDQIAELVGMSFGHGFGGKQCFLFHLYSLSFLGL